MENQAGICYCQIENDTTEVHPELDSPVEQSPSYDDTSTQFSISLPYTNADESSCTRRPEIARHKASDDVAIPIESDDETDLSIDCEQVPADMHIPVMSSARNKQSSPIPIAPDQTMSSACCPQKSMPSANIQEEQSHRCTESEHDVVCKRKSCDARNRPQSIGPHRSYRTPRSARRSMAKLGGGPAVNINVNIEKRHEVQSPTIYYVQRRSRTSSESSNTGRTGVSNVFISNKIENTRCRIENWKLGPYEPSKADDEAFEKLCRFGFIVITGHEGVGKTSLAMASLCRIATERMKTPMQIFCASEFEKIINVRSHYVVFIDDIFGKTNLNENALQKWKQRHVLLRDTVHEGNSFVIITMRKTIFAESRTTLRPLLQDLIDDDHIVDLTEERLQPSPEEKERLLLSHVKRNKRRVVLSREYGDPQSCRAQSDEFSSPFILTKSHVRSISNMTTPIGFPLCCELFVRDGKITQLGPAFFQKPMNIITEFIDIMRRENPKQYCTLVVIFLYDNFLPLVDLQNENSDKFNQKLQAAGCAVELQTPLNQGIVKNTADILSKNSCFVKFNPGPDSFCLAHEAIHEAVALSFADIKPTEIIKHCSLDFILESVVLQDRPRGYDPTGRVITINRAHYPVLANRLADDIQSCKVWQTSQHSAFFSSDFVKVFIKELENQDRVIPVLSVRDGGHGGTLLVYAANHDSPKLVLLRALIGVLNAKEKCEKRWQICGSATYKDNWIANEMEDAMYKACKHGKREIYQILCGANAPICDDTLKSAVNGKNEDIVSDLLKRCKWSGAQKEEALHAACEVGNAPVFDVLQKRVKVKYCSECVYKAAIGGECGIINRVMDRQKNKDDYFRFSDVHERTALHKAVVKGNRHAVKILLEKGFSINSRDKDGLTPLHYACRFGFMGIVNALLNWNKDRRSWTPDLNIRSFSGETALDVARKYGFSDIVEVIEAAMGAVT